MSVLSIKSAMVIFKFKFQVKFRFNHNLGRKNVFKALLQDINMFCFKYSKPPYIIYYTDTGV